MDTSKIDGVKKKKNGAVRDWRSEDVWLEDEFKKVKLTTGGPELTV